MSSRIVISDIHGCYKTLVALIEKLPTGIPITIAADLIDRGKRSREVVKFIRDNQFDCVIGNHEQMMLDELTFTIDPLNGKERAVVDNYHGIWMMNGGDITLDSYEVNEEIDITALKDDIAWMRTLPFYIEYKNVKNKKGDHLLVSHSTAARVWDTYPHDSPEFKSALLWDRDPYPSKIEGMFNVYGHTPQKGKATVKEHFACIDGGVYLKREGYGTLRAFQYPEEKLYSQKNIED